MTVIGANPILPGCYPDPSVCRVGDEYIVVSSSFAFRPGVPIHRSRDLRTWELIGHVLDDFSDLDLAELDASDGIWAPTIRHHNGTFYVVYTVAVRRKGTGIFITTATNPAGPWSTPVSLDGDGIDPSLFFDDDGSCWFTAARDALAPNATGPGEIWLRELDIRTLKLVGPEHVLWHGAFVGQWIEAPHLYKRNETYYLIAAEGGTERNHAVTAATAKVLTGPYQSDPRNPLLTHRHLGESVQIQNVGHADLVEMPNGEWVAVALGVRILDGVHVLGRESFVVPVEWTDSGPVFSPGIGMIPTPPSGAALRDLDRRDWISICKMAQHEWQDDKLLLAPSLPTKTSVGREISNQLAVLGIRQTAHTMLFRGTLSTPTQTDAAISMVAMQGQNRYVAITARHTQDGPVVEATLHDHAEITVLGSIPSIESPTVEIRSDGHHYFLSLVDTKLDLAVIPARTLSTEDVGGFVGVVLGFSHIAPSTSTWTEITNIEYSVHEVIRPEALSCDEEPVLA